MSDERVQQVIDELDPTPAHEVDWPVSRRQTLRALAAAGLLGAGAGSASAQSAGGVIADEAVFSNYDSESVSDGWEVTIDDDVFALTESEETIGLPDGGVGEEVVLPNGNEASEVIAPDGTVVFADVIPDSVIYQYIAGSFAGPWPDEINNADMTVNGLSSSTFSNGEASVAGDVEDNGIANGPQNLPENEAFGVAFTCEISTTDDNACILGVDGSNGYFRIRDNAGDGQFYFEVNDSNGNNLQTDMESPIDDGQPHAVVVNKSGNDASDIEWFIDDMGVPEQSVATNDSFSHNDYSMDEDMMFYAANASFSSGIAMDAGIFEFNTEPYSQSEREDFAARRPEV